MSKTPTKKPTKKPLTVQVIADGTNRVTLVFPEGVKLKGKKTIAVKEMAKVLSAVQSAKTEGQCFAYVLKKKFEVRTPSAIAGVRG